MTKDYYLEVWMGTRWNLVQTFKRHGDALEAIADRAKEGDRYSMRLVKVERTIVFGEGSERTYTRTKNSKRKKVAKKSRNKAELSTL